VSDIAWALIAAGFVIANATIAGCYWAVVRERIMAAARIRDEARAELEKGVVFIVEAARKEMHDARLEMKTFLANNRRA
jgi:hypothetical protein